MNDLQKEIVDGSSDILEFSIDLLTKNEILKEIPVVGLIVKSALIGSSISDRLLLKKIERFLHKFNEISNREKEKVIWKIRLDKEQKEQIGENILFLIDRYADKYKPEFLASIFGLFIEQKITQDEFIRLGNAIDLSFSPDLNLFLQDPNNTDVLKRLIRSGLSEISRVGMVPSEQIGGFNGMASVHSLIITDLGKLFLKLQN